ncbi:MAG TPA: HAMP domain-containing sensor histidine kinase [Acidimicrobiales bacterium]|nr:HAMP domain-containing sensor histidine kinase [Acidimicrobiales bacterium]
MPQGGDDAELRRRLDEVDALRRRVLNVIPHALRTPITTLRGLSAAMATASEDEIRSVIAPALNRLATQSEHLLDDMLIAAGYTTALPTAPPEATPVAAVARAVWSELGGGELHVEGDDSIEVMAPGGALFKVMVHLLDNAVKYGEPPYIVRIGREAASVVIEICTGGSVPAAELPMLGEPFFRAEAAVMRSAGLGVGLTVSRCLVEQAGGTLSISAPDHGGLVVRLVMTAADAHRAAS